MKPTRLHLAIGLVGVALLGVLLAARAQDRLKWAPPTVLPPIAKDGEPAAPKHPYQMAPAPKKTNTADPTMIVPPAVYSEPRAIGAPLEIKPDIVLVGGQMPAPMFPAGEPKTVAPPAPLPPIVDNPPAPLSVAEPTKVLLIDPPGMETAKPMAPLPTMEITKQPGAPLPAMAQPPVSKGPSLGPMLTDASPVAQEPAKSQPMSISVVDPVAGAKMKSFVRIRTALVEPVPIARDQLASEPIKPPPLEPFVGDLQKNLAPLPPLAGSMAAGALVNLQTPNVVVEKRGPASLGAGETQLYQIMIRNLGAVAAEQIRIEDELPANVRLLTADPMPAMQGARAVWLLPALAVGGERALKLTLKADANAQVLNNTSVHVSALSKTTRASSTPGALSIRLAGPDRIVVGKPAMFDIHVTNPTSQTLTGLVLHGELPPELVMQLRDQFGAMREERKIEGPVAGVTIAPGESKILKMPTNAVKPGRGTVFAKVVTNQGEASTSMSVDIAGETLLLQQAAATVLAQGRDGDLRIDLTNYTGKPLKNVAIANLLPEGFSFSGASDRGLYQSNSRTVHWFLEHLGVDATKTLVVRVQGSKTGQFTSHLSARADGVAEVRSSATLVVEGVADLLMKVTNGDNILELGRETVYEVHVKNPGSAPATNVQVQVQFPPGIVPKSAQADAKYVLDRLSVVFEPAPSLGPQGELVYRVSAVGQTVGLDQRIRFSVVSGESKTPLTREVSVMVYNANGQ